MNSSHILLNLFNRLPYLKMISYFGLALISVFIGALAVILPIQFIIAFLIIPLFLVLAWKFPEYAVFLLLLMLLGGIPSSYLPQISIAGGELRAEDLGLILLFLILLIKSFMFYQNDIRVILLPMKPYLISLGGFLLVAFLSAVIAILYKTAPIKEVFIEVRPYLTWLLLPILFMAINSERKIKIFKKMIIVLVALLSAVVVFESFSGISFSDKGQVVRTLWTSGQGAFQSVLRSTTPGIFLILTVLIYFISVYVFVNKPVKNIVLSLCLMTLLMLAVLVGFGRGIWLSLFVMIFFLGLIKPNKRYLKFVFWMITGMLIFIFILYLVKPSYVDAASQRLLSVSDEIKKGTSLERRFIENSFAVEKIMENPFLGVGLGGVYKPPGPESISWPNEVRYIHNSYINITTKLGVFGLFFGLVFIVVLFKRVYKAYKEVGKSKLVEIPVVFAVFSMFMTVFVFTSFTQPNIISVGGIVSIVIAIFFLESMFYRGGHSRVVIKIDKKLRKS